MWKPLKAVLRQFGYDNVENSGRKRKSSRMTYASEDDILTAAYRRQQLANARDLVRNYSPAVWAIGTHINSACSLRFHSRNGIKALDDRITELLNWWSRPTNFDVAGRMSLSSFVRMAETRAVVDGDVFALKTKSGLIQMIEGDRVDSLGTASTTGADMANYIKGIQVDDGGRPKFYCIGKRNSHSLDFERIIPARYITAHGFYSRNDMTRGITPLAASLNAYQDTAEASGYALLKMKVSQLIGLIYYNDTADGLASEVEGSERTEYEVNLSDGRPFTLQLDQGDRAEWLESKSPSTEFANFFQESLGMAFKTLFIPSCFYWSGSSYAESQHKIWLWFQFILARRDELRNLLNTLVAWRLSLWVADGTLILPRGWTVGNLMWEWVGAPMPSINVLDSVRAQIEKIGAGLTSPQRAVKELSGDDASEINNESADWKKERDALGLPPPVMKPTGQIPPPIPTEQT